MGGEWREVGLNELGEVARGRSRHRPRYAEHLYGGPYPFIQTGDVKASGGLITSHSQTYSEAGLAQSRLWPEGTLCITIAANIAETGILTYPACFPDSVIGFIADEEKCDVRFIEYRLRYLKSQLQREAIGSVQDNINLATFERLRFLIPNLQEQKRIAHILGTLDDKIELNRQMNVTLEAMAQALFKSWFVDFDPVVDNALAAGNPIPEPLHKRAEVRAALGDKRKPLPAAIQKQFPSSFVFSEEMGWFPEGWEVGCFGDISKHVKDGVKAEDVANYDYYVGLEHISRKQIFLTENGSGESIESNKSGFDEDDLLFGKLRPYFHKVCIAPQEGICSTDILVFRPSKPVFRSFMYLTAYTEAFVEYANMRSTGTRMPRASAKDMLDYVITIPSEVVLNSFEKMAAPYWGKGMEAVECSRSLSKLRDTLLPQLLSGQLRIPDAEKQVAGVVS